MWNLLQPIDDRKINDDSIDNSCQKNCKYLFNWKIFFMPLAIGLPILIYFEKLRNDFYIFFSCLISSLIICWNFPFLTKLGYTKPIYFEDLETTDVINKKIILNNLESSKKFQYKFIVIQQIILSLTLSIIIEYSTYRYKSSKLMITEILGIIGGLFSLYNKITRLIGKLLLNYLYRQKIKKQTVNKDKELELIINK